MCILFGRFITCMKMKLINLFHKFGSMIAEIFIDEQMCLQSYYLPYRIIIN